MLAARYSPVEKRVANGEAVDGSGLRRTGDDDPDDAEERVRERTAVDSEGIRGLLFLWGCA